MGPDASPDGGGTGRAGGNPPRTRAAVNPRRMPEACILFGKFLRNSVSPPLWLENWVRLPSASRRPSRTLGNRELPFPPGGLQASREATPNFRDTTAMSLATGRPGGRTLTSRGSVPFRATGPAAALGAAFRSVAAGPAVRLAICTGAPRRPRTGPIGRSPNDRSLAHGREPTMALLKKMLGNSSKDRELADDVRAALAEMREERERFERLLESSQGASERLATIDEPVTRLAGGLDEAVGRLAEVEGRLAALSAVAGQVDGIAATTTSMSEAQQEAQAHLETVVADAERIRTVFEELAEKTDLAEGLRGRLEAFLEIEKPFTLLRGEAEGIRTQIEGTTDQLGRLREQHDRLMDAHKLATSKMEALDRRREELSRDLTDKERRVVDVERAVKEMDGLRQGIADGKRQMGSLKSLADQLSQKTATLEAQREAVDRALAQADQLERAIAQVENGTARQLENEKSLAMLQDKLTELASLHESVLERSAEIGALQAESSQRITAIHDDLDVAKTEARNAVERFDFESKGLESTSHRVADLRTTLADFEGRFRGLREASETVRDLSAKTSGLI